MTNKKKQVRPEDLPEIVRQLLERRGIIDDVEQLEFLNPSYEPKPYDPYLLPGMTAAVERLRIARDCQEKVTIYCDYDVDGTTSAAVLLDALPRFNLIVDYYVPDRFKEGYGLNKAAIKLLKENGTNLILTVDNGIVSYDEVAYASEIGLDVIITDHHSPRNELPAAVAVVDPKILARDHPQAYDNTFRLIADNKSQGLYPFLDLCGCGVAFKLVQALQQQYPADLPSGQEKWLLDLVALATVSDVVSLVDENRSLVYWGLKVISQTKRPGLKALAAVAGLELTEIDSQVIGFVLGPRINAAGRLTNAKLAVELLSTTDPAKALDLANTLNDLNNQRKSLQLSIYNQAIKQIKPNLPVAVATGKGWHEGVIGIVASKVEEAVQKPTFIFSLDDNGIAHGSGRSFGDFSIASVINVTSTMLIKGGGHAAAGGVTIDQANLSTWCKSVNDYYKSLELVDQAKYLYPEPDLDISNFADITVQLVQSLTLLEPFGAANHMPTFLLKNVILTSRRLMGSELQHVRYTFSDDNGHQLQAVAFNAAEVFTIEPGEFGEIVRVDALVELTINEWNGELSVQGKLIKLDPARQIG